MVIEKCFETDEMRKLSWSKIETNDTIAFVYRKWNDQMAIHFV